MLVAEWLAANDRQLQGFPTQGLRIRHPAGALEPDPIGRRWLLTLKSRVQT
jgi:hypothetical protein